MSAIERTSRRRNGNDESSQATRDFRKFPGGGDIYLSPYSRFAGCRSPPIREVPAAGSHGDDIGDAAGKVVEPVKLVAIAEDGDGKPVPVFATDDLVEGCVAGDRAGMTVDRGIVLL